MISIKWLLFVFMLVLVGNLLCSFVYASETGDFGQTPMGKIMRGIPFYESQTETGSVFGTAIIKDFFEGLGGVLSWNYSFLNGDLYGFPLSIVKAMGLMLSTVVVIQVGLVFVNALRSLFPG